MKQCKLPVELSVPDLEYLTLLVVLTDNVAEYLQWPQLLSETTVIVFLVHASACGFSPSAEESLVEGL